MRSLFPDSRYFQFLDNVRAEFEPASAHVGQVVESDENGVLASLILVREFPTLRMEEARAVFCDWRMSRRGRCAR